MAYRLWIENEATLEMRKLPGDMRQRIRRAIQLLATEPRPHYSRQMRPPAGIHQEVRRLRIENWRVVYVVDEEFLEVGVLAIRKRPPYDYQDLVSLLT